MINGTYNNTLKYKHICEEIQNNICTNNYIKFKNKYEDINLLCEDILEKKLTKYQKLILDKLNKTKNIDLLPIVRSGRTFDVYNYMYRILLKECDNNE